MTDQTKGLDKMKKVFAVMVALLLCISLFAGCGEKYISTADADELNSSIVTKVGDVEITQAYYNFIYNLLYTQMSQYEQYYGADWINMEIDVDKTIGDYIKENTQAQIEQLAAATVIAKEYGIKVDSSVEKAVKSLKEEIIKSYGSEENFKTFLEESRTTDMAVTTYLEMYEVFNKLFEKITAKGEKAYIADKEIEKEFLEEYKDKLRVQHILISTQEQTDEKTGETIPARSDEEAQKLVKEIIAKLDKGEDFDKLITEYDEDPGMEAGKFYVFGEGEMVAEFEQASKDLKVGEYTKEGVKTSYGYHIIKKYEINSEIEEFDTFKNTKLQEKVTEILEKKVKDLKVKWDEKTIDKYIENWIKERKKENEKTASDAGVTMPSEEDLEAVESETKAE